MRNPKLAHIIVNQNDRNRILKKIPQVWGHFALKWVNWPISLIFRHLSQNFAMMTTV